MYVLPSLLHSPLSKRQKMMQQSPTAWACCTCMCNLRCWQDRANQAPSNCFCLRPISSPERLLFKWFDARNQILCKFSANQASCAGQRSERTKLCLDVWWSALAIRLSSAHDRAKSSRDLMSRTLCLFFITFTSSCKQHTRQKTKGQAQS